MKNKLKILLFVGFIIFSILGLRFFYRAEQGPISDGYESGASESIGFSNNFRFDKHKGEKIQYKVENLGSGDIRIRVNESEEKLVRSGDTESLFYTIRSQKENLNFKAYSANDRVKINYQIEQK